MALLSAGQVYASPAFTPNTGTCQTISQGPNWQPISMYFPNDSNMLIAVPGSLGSNGSDFQVNYQW